MLIWITTKMYILLQRTNSCNAGDVGLIPTSGKCPGEENDNPLQYSCLGTPMDRAVGRLQSMGSQKSWTQLSK